MSVKAKPPAPLRKPATLDHLRKPRQLSRYVSFCTEDIPEPDGLKLTATDAQRKAQVAARNQWEAEVEENTVEFQIHSLPRKQYKELVEAHPPTDEQIQQASERGDPRPLENVETFSPALIAESIEEPAGVTLDDALAIWEGWPPGEVQALANICIILNQTSRLEFYQKKSGTMSG